MKKVIIFFMVIAILFTLVACITPSCTPVFGADAAQQAAQSTRLGSAIKDVVEGTVIPLLISLIGALVSIVLVKLKNKFNVQLSAETEAWINGQAENAVQMVAEKAAAKLKLEDIAIGSSDKLNMAIASLITHVPKLTRDQADAYIHAALARIPGIGATGDAALTAK